MRTRFVMALSALALASGSFFGSVNHNPATATTTVTSDTCLPGCCDGNGDGCCPNACHLGEGECCE